jgi:hypothetical protein
MQTKASGIRERYHWSVLSIRARNHPDICYCSLVALSIPPVNHQPEALTVDAHDLN